jgi:endonuclease YncB( thermonuclease family)
MMRVMVRIGPVILALLLVLPAAAQTLSGRPLVTDGDTLVLESTEISLWGIAAPARDQICTADDQPYQAGELAMMVLTLLIAEDPVTCTPRGTDRHGHAVAQCAVAGGDLGSMLVAAGWARDVRVESGGSYALEEAQARAAGLGIWGGPCPPPREERQQ